MDYNITSVSARKIAGVHMVGPWEQTVKQGFEQLMAWVVNSQIPAKEWVAVYYGNPEQVPPQELRCDTAVTVAGDYALPPGSEGITLAEIPAGEYACARVRILDNDFTTPWLQFFTSLQQCAEYQMACEQRPCFEVYLNDGNADGYWDIDMYIAVKPAGE